MIRVIEKQFHNVASVRALFSGLLIKKLCFLSFLFLSVNSAALDDGTWTYELNADGVTVTGCSGTCPAELTIPYTIAGKSVTSIGHGAFRSSNLMSATIPNSVTSIDDYAFSYTSLTSIDIPNSVTSIGDYAFKDTNITSVVIPSSLTTIGTYAFAEMPITSIDIPDTVTSIGHGAFSSSNLMSATIPNSVTSIGDYAFSYTSLTSIAIPNSVSSIGDYAFKGTQINKISFLGDRPDIHSERFDSQALSAISYCPGTSGWPGNTIGGITPQMDVTCDTDNDGMSNKAEISIGTNVFLADEVVDDDDILYFLDGNNVYVVGCSGRCKADLIIPQAINGHTVTIIAENAFEDTLLESVTIPDSILKVGSRAFNNSQLSSVTISGSVTEIGSYAFANNQLTSVTLPDSLVTIANETFRDNQLISVILPSRLVSLGQGAFRNNKLTSITIPPNVISIGNGAFNSNKLTSVTIPASVFSIGANAFNKNNLVSISFLGQRPALNADNTFSANGGIIDISYCAGMNGWPGDGLKKSADEYMMPAVTTLNDDSDCDGVADTFDPFPNNPFEWMDNDADNLGNNEDTDDDGDGIFDSLDAYPLDPTNQPIQLLDVDGNGQFDTLTDALLITRYGFGFTGDTLTDGAIGEGATRTSPDEIEAYLEALIPEL